MSRIVNVHRPEIIFVASGARIASVLIEFRKMHGNGNDFVVTKAPSEHVCPDAATVRRLSDRRRGIGFDQLLWIETAANDDADAAYRVFNADGSEVEQCGNGVRCVARFLADENPGKTELRLASAAGIVTARLLDDGLVAVDIGEPVFAPEQIPLRAGTAECTEYERVVHGQSLRFSALSFGNPHAVLRVSDTATAGVEKIGAALQSDALFPAGVNVGFLQITDRASGTLRVYERGVGETAACGTGACAAMVAGRRLNLFDTRVRLKLPGGELMVSWRGPGTGVWLTGPAETAFGGRLAL